MVGKAHSFNVIHGRGALRRNTEPSDSITYNNRSRGDFSSSIKNGAKGISAGNAFDLL
jgi:hypothetical protein